MSRAIHHLGVLVALFVLVGPISASNAFASVSPAGAIVAPGASQQFTAHLVGVFHCPKFTWQLLPNASGGTISTTGLYTAGSTENLTDTVVAAFPYGTRCPDLHADVSVSVLKVLPVPVQHVETGASQPFTVSGGSGTGYTWSFVTNASGGSLSAAGVYTAGASGGVSDGLKVVDSMGHAATFTVLVVYPPPPVQIFPSGLIRLAPTTSQTFHASGGSGSGYAWAFATNASGGTLSASGVYTAGAANDVTDLLRVTDSMGDFATATVAVSTLAVSPSQVNLAPKASQTFTVSGGSGTGYVWDFANNGSGGTVSTAGVYEAGATGNPTTDVVRATDSLGYSATATVTVAVPPLSISPSRPTLAPAESLAFSASGGSPRYTWAIATNNSGGSVSTTGVYTAGAARETTDVVRVTDSLGVYVTATVTVTTALSISPSGPTLAPVESQAFSASGGSPPYTWAIAPNASGATLNGAGDAGIPEGPSVEYQAGATGDVADDVRLTDSLGVSVSATVTVTAALSITPPGVVTLEAKSSHAFTASGGRGPYTWALATNASGGTVSESGEYTAGAKGNVADVVQVTDSLGTSTTASVMVTSSGGCGTTDGGTFPLLALLVLPLLASRRKRSTQLSMTSASM